MTRGVEYCVHNSRDDSLCKRDAQVNIFLKLLLLKKFFRRNAGFIFTIGFQTVFWGTYFCNLLIQKSILRIKLCDFRPKSQKQVPHQFIPQELMITKISGLKEV